MYNMEIYCIENLYWTRRQYGFSIQYRRVQYISILYITLYNNLLLLYHRIKQRHYYNTQVIIDNMLTNLEKSKMAKSVKFQFF